MVTLQTIKAWLQRWGVDSYPTISDLAYASEHKECHQRLTFAVAEIERLQTEAAAGKRLRDAVSKWCEADYASRNDLLFAVEDFDKAVGDEH